MGTFGGRICKNHDDYMTWGDFKILKNEKIIEVLKKSDKFFLLIYRLRLN